MDKRKILPSKSQRQYAIDYGYAIGEQARKRLIGWFKKTFWLLVVWR